MNLNLVYEFIFHGIVQSTPIIYYLVLSPNQLSLILPDRNNKLKKWEFQMTSSEYPTKKKIKNMRHDILKSLKLINGPEC